MGRGMRKRVVVTEHVVVQTLGTRGVVCPVTRRWTLAHGLCGVLGSYLTLRKQRVPRASVEPAPQVAGRRHPEPDDDRARAADPGDVSAERVGDPPGDAERERLGGVRALGGQSV